MRFANSSATCGNISVSLSKRRADYVQINALALIEFNRSTTPGNSKTDRSNGLEFTGEPTPDA